jgi:cell division protein FtsL
MSSPAVQIRHRVPRIAQEAVERARLSVVPRARTRAPKVPFVTLVSLVLVGGIVGLLLFNTSMQQASFAATSLEGQASALTAREQTLRMELDVLRNPQRVAEQAQKQGMVPGQVPVPIDLREGRILTTPAGATAPAPTTLRLRPLQQLPAILDPAPLKVRAAAGDAGSSAGCSAGSSAGPGESAGAAAALTGTNEARQQQENQKPQKNRN